MKRIALLTLLMLTAAAAWSQAVRVDIPLQITGPDVPITGGNLPQALWLANAQIQVCVHPATIASCTPATTYNDYAKDAQCPSNAPLVLLPGVSCVSSVGAAADIGFWYGGGIVDYIVTSSYGTFGPYSVTGGNSASSGSVTSISFTGDGTIFQTGPTTPVTSAGTLAPALVAQVANCILAGPATGSNAAPTCRALVAADLPSGINGISSVTQGYIPLGGTGGNTITGNSHIDDGVTTPNTITSTENINEGGTIAELALGTAVDNTANYASDVFDFDISYFTTTTVNDAWSLSTYVCPYASCGTTPTTVFNITGPTSLSGITLLAAQNPAIAATSGANIPTACLGLRGATWNGSASQLDDWDICGTYGSGSNPSSTLVFSKKRGTSGTQAVQMPGLVVTGPGGNPGIQLTSAAFATYPACSSSLEGLEEAVTDSTTNTWGATVTGSGSDHVKMYCDGTNWTVEAK
jgi:hypothetical protein